MSRRFFIKLLNRAGYDLRKMDIYREMSGSGEHLQTSGWRVEFIGAYGAGKTTQFYAVWPQYEQEWFSRKQLRLYTERRRIKTYDLTDARFATHYEKLLVLKFHNLFQSSRSMANKVELYDFFKTQLGLDLYFSNCKLSRGLFSDDGIIHNFAEELLEMAQDGDEALPMDSFLSHLFNKRALIYLKADPGTIEGHLKTRSVEMPGAGNDWLTYWQASSGAEEIPECIALIVARVERLVALADRHGAPVLRLDVKKGTAHNGREVGRFLEGLKIKV